MKKNIIICFLFFILFLAAGCCEDGAPFVFLCPGKQVPSYVPYPTAPPGDVNFETIDKGKNSSITNAYNALARDQQELVYIWQKHTENVFPPPTTPRVEFKTQMLFGVFGGKQLSSLARKIEITKITVTEDKVIVYAQETDETKGAEELENLIITSPFHLVKMQHSNNEVEFKTNFLPVDQMKKIINGQRILKGALTSIKEFKALAVYNNQDWYSLWQEYNKSLLVPSEIQEVDFSDKTLLALFLGERPNNGYDIDIAYIVETIDKIYAFYKDISPAPGTPVIDIPSYPFIMVTIDKTNKPVEFKKSKNLQ